MAAPPAAQTQATDLQAVNARAQPRARGSLLVARRAGRPPLLLLLLLLLLPLLLLRLWRSRGGRHWRAARSAALSFLQWLFLKSGCGVPMLAQQGSRGPCPRVLLAAQRLLLGRSRRV